MDGELTKLMPLDKSWMIRMGLLDLQAGNEAQTIAILEAADDPSGDLQALVRCLQTWPDQGELDVGESGTLYRFLRYLAWQQGSMHSFIRRGTLAERKINDNPEIVGWSQSKLLTLDGGTSQWASAAALCGDGERLADPPFKLALSYQAIVHHKMANNTGNAWQVRTDATITRQAAVFEQAYREVINTPATHFDFIPQQAEDFCFAVAFGYMTIAEGAARWPAMRAHESNRPREMKAALAAYEKKRPLTSLDHRVVQAMVMKASFDGESIEVKHPEAVRKSWPKFWEFIEAVQNH